jgi:hypothetical protein
MTARSPTVPFDLGRLLDAAQAAAPVEGVEADFPVDA